MAGPAEAAEPAEPGQSEQADPGAGSASAPPPTLWRAVRPDVLVLVLVLGAVTVNVISPDALSPGLTPLLFAAAAWVAYRIVRTAQRLRARD